MRIAYNCPELDIEADTCFNKEEQVFLEAQIKVLEGKTVKQKNPFLEKKLVRYTWCIARLGGWKGYEKPFQMISSEAKSRAGKCNHQLSS